MEQIRYAKAQEAEKIYDLMMRVWEGMEHKEWYITDTPAYLRSLLAGRGYALLCEAEGELAGFLTMVYPEAEDTSYTRFVGGACPENSIHSESCAVDPRFRGRGIERRLLERAAQIEREKGTRYMLCTIHPENQASLRSALRAGYEVAVTSDRVYEGHIRCVMVRRLFEAPGVVLLEPEIPQNTGNIGRTCVVTGSRLHLIEPLGFHITEKNLKRAGMDYWPRLDVTRYSGFEDFLSKNPAANLYFMTTKGQRLYTEVSYEPDAYLVFGKESAGIPEEILMRYPDRCLRIPMLGESRSLNLSNSVAVALFEVLRQQDFKGLKLTGELHRHRWSDVE